MGLPSPLIHAWRHSLVAMTQKNARNYLKRFLYVMNRLIDGGFHVRVFRIWKESRIVLVHFSLRKMLYAQIKTICWTTPTSFEHVFANLFSGGTAGSEGIEARVSLPGKPGICMMIYINDICVRMHVDVEFMMAICEVLLGRAAGCVICRWDGPAAASYVLRVVEKSPVPDIQ